MSEQVAAETPAQLRIRFQRVEALLVGLPGASLDLDVQAAILGVTPSEMREFLANSIEAVQRAADQLGSECSSEIRFIRKNLAGKRLLLYGDSITADRQSWAEITKTLLEPDVTVVTGGRSGDTTADLLARFASAVRDQHPDLVVVLAGTNDARQYMPTARGDFSGPTALSEGETTKNVAELGRLIRVTTGNDAIWIAPPPIVESRLSTDRSAAQAGVGWRQENIRARADIVSSIFPTRAARLEPAFGSLAECEGFMLEDGLHPNLEGHMVITRVALQLIASGALDGEPELMGPFSAGATGRTDAKPARTPQP